MDGFNNTVKSTTTDNNKTILSVIYNGRGLRNETDIYSLKVQNAAFKALYDSFNSHWTSCSGIHLGVQTCSSSTATWKIEYNPSGNIKTFKSKLYDEEFVSTGGSAYVNSSADTLDDVKVSIKNHITAIASEIETEIGFLKECTDDFKNDINSKYYFKPEVNFNYADEPDSYKAYFRDIAFKSTSSSGDVYGTRITPDPVFNTGDVEYYQDEANLKTTSYSYSDVILEEQRQATREYESNINFYRESGSGKVSIIPGANLVAIGNVYPVALTTSNGNHDYYLYFSKLGQVGLTNSSGRLDKYLSSTNKLKYTCYYNLDEDVLVNDKPNYFFRSVSLNNFAPNESTRLLGKNWTNNKGDKTLEEINNKNEEIYNDVAEYHIELTPTNMLKIKEYNKKKEELGLGYGDFDMTAVFGEIKDRVGNPIKDEDGNNITGLWYESNFLNELLSNDYADAYTTSKSGIDKFTGWSIIGGTPITKLSGTGPAWK